MAASDNALTEEVIKRRLLVDGDGMGDERKLNGLLKSYLTFVESDDTAEEDEASLRRLSSQTNQMEYVARRTVESIRMNEKGQELYEELGLKVESEIVETKQQIDESKALLEEATKHRKYSMEYDALAKLIGSKPDRKLTEEKRKRLESDMESLRERKENLDDRLDSKKRSVSMLSSTIHLLRGQQNAPEETSKKSKSSSPSRRHMEREDSTSQSDPSSPMDVQQNSEDSSKASSEPKKVVKTENGAANLPVNSTEKSKSEKYEDLSESDGDENS